MHDKKTLEKQFEEAFARASATSPVFSHAAKQQMAKMVEVCTRGSANIESQLATNQNPAIKAGFLAEEFHSVSFNLDATLKESNLKAITDRDAEWFKAGFKKNDIADIAIQQDGRSVHTVQSKYYINAETTTAKMSQRDANGASKYRDMDTLLGPSDQVHPTDGSVSIQEHAEAAAHGNEARSGNPNQTEAYKQTAGKVNSTIEHDGVSSSPLSKSEADAMGRGDLRKIKQIENQYKTRSTLQQMGRAGLGAAAMSAVVSGSINIVRYTQMARDGKITQQEAVVKIVGETAASAADSAIKASGVVGVQSLMVRYGCEKVAIERLASQSMKSLLRGNVATIGVVCAVEAIKDMVALGMGKLTKEQFTERQGKGLINTSTGVVGGTLGAVAADAVAVSMGFALPVAAPLIGGLAGGLIAGLAMDFAIENHIEKPYRDLMLNTDNLNQAAQELQRLSSFVFQSQVLFTKILERENQLDRLFEDQVADMSTAGRRALSAINNI